MIYDQPRFQYRGLHLDVGRHFFPVSFIKQYIDWLAYHKLNRFHWHLTEDQGWRIEIKKYPELTRVGAWRNGTIVGRYPGQSNTQQRYGGFYTQEEIKEVVNYAAERGIRIIPEFDVPGHTTSWLAGYPELGSAPGPYAPDTIALGVFRPVMDPTNPDLYTFLDEFVAEMVTLFPDLYFHIMSVTFFIIFDHIYSRFCFSWVFTRTSFTRTFLSCLYTVLCTIVDMYIISIIYEKYITLYLLTYSFNLMNE